MKITPFVEALDRGEVPPPISTPFKGLNGVWYTPLHTNNQSKSASLMVSWPENLHAPSYQREEHFWKKIEGQDSEFS